MYNMDISSLLFSVCWLVVHAATASECSVKFKQCSVREFYISFFLNVQHQLLRLHRMRHDDVS
jgi:hypothetical protein